MFAKAIKTVAPLSLPLEMCPTSGAQSGLSCSFVFGYWENKVQETDKVVPLHRLTNDNSACKHNKLEIFAFVL